jgi:hypothetical protein
MISPLAQINIRSTFFNQHSGANRLASSPGSMISYLLPNIMILAGIMFFLLILIGGFGIIGGAGKQPNAQDAAKSKAALTYGVIGFLLVISSYFILEIISTLTGIPFINLPNL